MRSPSPSSRAATAVMRGNRSRDTRPERELRSALHRLGLRFRKNARPIRDVAFRADVVFPKQRVAVALDGCFWHACPEHGVQPRTNSEYWSAKLARNVARDRANDEALRTAGWILVRVWEHEATEDAATRIAMIIREQQAERATA